MEKNTLNGGSFNLRYGRPTEVVKGEVTRLLKKHDLDFLCVQEGTDYFGVLRDIKGYDYFATREIAGGTECGILVKKAIPQGKPKYRNFGDGWITVRGGNHAPTVFPRIKIDGWLTVGSLHLPTPIYFNGDNVTGPAERVDDYMAIARKIYRYLKFGKGSRIAVGDFNEPLSNTAKWAPGGIVRRIKGAVAQDTKSRAGHGRIDYVIGKNVELSNVRKDLEIAEGSDHEPVTFKVRQK